MKFADTSWWVGWAVPRDGRHPDAVAMLDLVDPGEKLLTTDHIVGETWTVLARRGSHRSALAFLERIETLVGDARLTVHSVTPSQERKAWAWLRRHDERVYSFVDATSFQVMRERRVREALAFDQNFSAAGFIELRP
jgi:uncharacterized protein